MLGREGRRVLNSKVDGCDMEVLGAGFWDGDFGDGVSMTDSLLALDELNRLSLVGGGWTKV